ncbi:DUF1990 family protein [Luteimicrobium sp. NPDC057192]|uniref:DUF1990 family protein n=1 Tax=Luteimicrobium sp. NPDC057192 TaxID=3346042 RepID=UPI00362F66DB
MLPDPRAAWPGPALDRAHPLHVSGVVGRGPEAFARAADALATWRMHDGAGVRVSDPSGGAPVRAAVGVRVRVRLGPLPLGGTCLVVDAGRDDRAAWVLYATEPDHAEEGTERFAVLLDDDGDVRGDVAAWSQPRAWALRVAGPAGRIGQRVIARRYVSALAGLSRRP